MDSNGSRHSTVNRVTNQLQFRILCGGWLDIAACGCKELGAWVQQLSGRGAAAITTTTKLSCSPAGADGCPGTNTRRQGQPSAKACIPLRMAGAARCRAHCRQPTRRTWCSAHPQCCNQAHPQKHVRARLADINICSHCACPRRGKLTPALCQPRHAQVCACQHVALAAHPLAWRASWRPQPQPIQR
jgi:hypothetical protein